MALIEERFIGKTYRLMTRRLRIQRGPGKADLVAERAPKGSSRAYTDTAEKPVLITFDKDCRVDVAFLLELGAIEETSVLTEKPTRAKDRDG